MFFEWFGVILGVVVILVAVLACDMTQSAPSPTPAVPTVTQAEPTVTATVTATATATAVSNLVVDALFVESGGADVPLTGFPSEITGQDWAVWSGDAAVPTLFVAGSSLGWATNDGSNQYQANQIALTNYTPSTDTVTFSFTFEFPSMTNNIDELKFYFTDGNGNGQVVMFSVYTGAPFYRLAARGSDSQGPGVPWGNNGAAVIDFRDGVGALTPSTDMKVTGTIAPNGDMTLEFITPIPGESIASFSIPGASFVPNQPSHEPSTGYSTFSMLNGCNGGPIASGFLRVTEVLVTR